MKHLFVILLVIGSIKVNTLFSQTNTTIPNSFVIHGQNLKPDDVSFFTKSILAANMEQFRLQTQTVVLQFKNGFDLELISAKDLVVRNIKSDLDINAYSNFPAMANYKYPLFEILKSGWLTAEGLPVTK